MEDMKSNIWKLYVCSVLRSMVFFVPVLVPFLAGIGLGLKEVLIVEAAFSVTVMLMEVPSGYFADIYGRRLSMILGAVFFMLSMVAFSFADTFTGFFFAEILGGLGISFHSGANEALLYDSLLVMKEERRYKKMQGNMFFAERVASVFANMSGGFMALWFLRFPVYMAVLPAVLWVIFSFTLSEPTRHGPPIVRKGYFRRIFTESFFGHPRLKWFILYTAFPSGLALAVFWMFQGYMELVGVPILFFGIVIGVMNVFSAIAAKFAQEIEEWLGLKWSLISIPLLFCVAWIPLAFISEQWAIAFIFLSSIAWGFSNPVYGDFVQKLVTSDRRATIMSTKSLFGRALFVAAAPFLGLAADVYDVQTAILFSAIALFVASAFTIFMLRRVKVL